MGLFMWGVYGRCVQLLGFNFCYNVSAFFLIRLFYMYALAPHPSKNKKTTTRVKTLYLLSELNPLRTRVSSMFSNVSIIPHEISPTGVVFFFFEIFLGSPTCCRINPDLRLRLRRPSSIPPAAQVLKYLITPRSQASLQ